MKKELIQKLHANFEECAQSSEGVDYWLARQLQLLLGYSQWRNFELVIEKAKIACLGAGQLVEDHFADVSKMIELGKGATREVDDVALTRYACYLIAQKFQRYVVQVPERAFIQLLKAGAVAAINPEKFGG